MSTQDFVPSNTFSQGLILALETDQRGEAPSGVNQFWFQGGKWVPVVTQELPSLYDRQETIFPSGHAGKRSMNIQPPVQGRRWSDGGFSVVVTSEFMGHILYAATGAASSNVTPGTDVALLSASELSDGITMALTTQPSNGGAKLQIKVQGVSGSGQLTIAGTNAEGKAASETINYDVGPTTLYTRTSFSAVTGITVDAHEHASGGSISVNGIQYWTHRFTMASTNPTFSIERIGDPAAGAASKSFMYVGMVLTDLTMNAPAEARDGILTIESNWEGDPSATCTAKGIQEASSLRIWPAWITSITRDGSAYNRARNISFTINTGNRNYRSAAGVQNPQGSFFGGREATGSIDLLLADETEFNRWRGASSQPFVFTFQSPWKLTSAVYEKLTASMLNAYLENVEAGDDDGMFTYSSDFRMVVDAANEIAAYEMISGMPAEVYGGSTVLS